MQYYTIKHDMWQWWANLLQSGISEFEIPMNAEFEALFNQKRDELRKFFATELEYATNDWQRNVLALTITERFRLSNPSNPPLNPLFPIANL